MSDNMRTYRAHLSADYLSKHLLMKHVAEVNGWSIIWGQEQVEEDFHKLAERLGYRIEKIEHQTMSEAELIDALDALTSVTTESSAAE